MPTGDRHDTHRRRLLAGLGLGLMQAGCALPVATADRVFELATGRELDPAALAAVLRRADRVLLGERHDNPHHHQRRGALIASLGAATATVAEHLPRGARVSYGADILERLVDAGFDAKAWQWPTHQALFGPLVSAGRLVVGGNLPRSLARQIGREGSHALPSELRELIEAAPLSAAAQATLDRELIDGHCGQLEGPRLTSMRWAQRARDASMALAMHAAGGAPTVLVAGNGHVRKDYGVPVFLSRMRAHETVICIGFTEHGAPSTELPYDYMWVTVGMSRIDPCKGFVIPGSAAASAPRP